MHVSDMARCFAQVRNAGESGHLLEQDTVAVAEQQPWALLDNREAQNLEMPRNGIRENDPVDTRVLQKPLLPHDHAG
jgi:hypothetical protein